MLYSRGERLCEPEAPRPEAPTVHSLTKREQSCEKKQGLGSMRDEAGAGPTGTQGGEDPQPRGKRSTGGALPLQLHRWCSRRREGWREREK